MNGTLEHLLKHLHLTCSLIPPLIYRLFKVCLLVFPKPLPKYLPQHMLVSLLLLFIHYNRYILPYLPTDTRVSVFDLDALFMSLREPLVWTNSPCPLIIDLMLTRLSLCSCIAYSLINSLTLVVNVFFNGTGSVLLHHTLQALKSVTGGVVIFSLRLEWIVLKFVVLNVSYRSRS